ncbi:DEAD/DEAH box helicase family protein [Paraburkholderia youngii]|uniref:DEAD/DEAH box helicase family protein n=1 Tax=Paraburkholderia youngii TaxID=2782701 RepID=UPI003D20B44E
MLDLLPAAVPTRPRRRGPKREKPRAHQTEAVMSVIVEFSTADRATIVCACGTGKTLVGAEVFGELGDDSRYTIVFAPTLALLAQTIETWRRQYPERLRNCLCVCSDASVVAGEGDNVAVVDLSDLQCVVTTNAVETHEVLKRVKDGLVVFCTYSSAPVIAEAMPAGFEFDLGIFDEAHRTAGDPDRRFGVALTDSEIPIAKRLFMTATERLVRSNQISPEYLYSMDNERVYGRVVFRLTLGEAIRRRLVCDYKILLGCVRSGAQIPGHWLDLPTAGVSPSHASGAELAALHALYETFENFNVSRAITFHDRVATALAFQSLAKEVPAPSGMRRINAYHVNGTMRVGDRAAVMDAYRADERAIATNARCLAEGVDVPEVELVALMSRRASPIEVTQMCGRALRLSPKTGKTEGYIFVPIYLSEEHQSGVDDPVGGADFTVALEALAAMASFDESLHQALALGASDSEKDRRQLRG